ncbi:hypothetical protein DER45DRAFT_568703 [Fusarium avenaceum]|nr:hypothetical protein DER45DRAFT_568703 [Fusarium avenaceum]
MTGDVLNIVLCLLMLETSVCMCVCKPAMPSLSVSNTVRAIKCSRRSPLHQHSIASFLISLDWIWACGCVGED